MVGRVSSEEGEGVEELDERRGRLEGGGGEGEEVGGKWVRRVSYHPYTGRAVRESWKGM